MNKIYIFDVDGTLTPSRQKMTEEFKNFFHSWSEKNFFFLVSGSDLPKLQEQIDDSVMNSALGVFCCAGNTLYINNELQYDNEFNPPDNLIEYLKHQLEIAEFLPRCGNHIENRGSMVNFSIVGRDCSLEKRKMYFEYDNKEGERKKIAETINNKWPELEATIGGQISIDIYPKGKDKSQILYYIEKIIQRKTTSSYHAFQYHFIGDRTMEGGNDYPLAKAMNLRNDSKVHQTQDWKETQQILESLND